MTAGPSDSPWCRYTFELCPKAEADAEDPKIVEQGLELVRLALAKAEIKWNPPNARTLPTTSRRQISPRRRVFQEASLWSCLKR